MSRKVIPAAILKKLIYLGIYREAEEENMEIGHALKSISEQELEKILEGGKRNIYRRKAWERVAWAASVAALIAVAIAVPVSLDRRAKNELCDIVYAYNAPELNEMIAAASRSSADRLPDVTKMTDAELRSFIPALQKEFEESDNSQDIAIKGKLLALSYIRLHKRKEARETLEAMIERLSSDEDYESTVAECRNLLEQIK